MNKVLLNSVERRRMSCPQLVQQLWDAIKVTKYQQQKPTLEKIAKFMSRTYSVSEEEVSRQLQNCVRDKLLFVKKTKISKGSKVGVEQEGYRLPEFDELDEKKESHDWYCWKCHTGGDVVPCHQCYRVYHVSCASNLQGSKEKYICTVCQSIEDDKSLSYLKLRKLNRLLSFVCSQLKGRYSSLINRNEYLKRPIFVGSTGAQVDISQSKEIWRVRFLVYEPIDLGSMMATAKKENYLNVAQFVAHAQSIVHSVVIFHGALSNLADKSRQMLRECMAQLEQMESCPSCYESAILAPNRFWFCKPCRPPHTLIFAGSPFMPAKVLRERDDKLEVVFFGPEHNRATVDKDSTLPITTAIGQIGKSSANWSKAMDELSRHQKMLLSYNNSSSSSDTDGEEVKNSSSEIKETKKAELPKVSPVAKVKSPKKVSPVPKVTPPVERFSSDEDDEVEEEEPIKKETLKRKRGRPPKTSTESWNLKRFSSDEEDEVEEEEPVKKETLKRKRGRPPKTSTESWNLKSSDGEDVDKKEVVLKKRRGRPPLKKVESPVTKSASTPEVPKRRPGRPRKKASIVKIPDSEPEEDKDDEEEEEEIEAATPAPAAPPVEAEDDAITEPRTSPSSLHRPESPSTSLAPSASTSSTKKNEEEIVSSSCIEPPDVRSVGTQTNRKDLIAKLKEELDEVRYAHAEEIKAMKEAHAAEVAATKKKQWCYNCEREAIYHCCWNTAYCSTECQQVHWQGEHKRVCRRKR